MKEILKKIKRVLKDFYERSMDNKKVMVLDILVIIAVIVVIVFAFNVRNEVTNYKVKNEKIYMYFGKERFDFKGSFTINTDKNITNIKLNGKNANLDYEPIYFADKKEVVFPKTMAIVFPLESGNTKKVTYYAKIKQDNDDIYLTNKIVNNRKLANTFLFDGNDLYFFIENVSVSFGNKKIDISPLSFVIYNSDNELYIYDYSSDKMYMYTNISNPIASNSNYKINLKEDTLLYKSKTQVLMKKMKYLKNYK